MERVKPSRSRIQVLREVGRTCIVMRPRRHVFPILFLPVWLAGWAAGEVSVIGMLLKHGLSGGSAFLAVWLALWTFGGVAAFYSLAYTLAGREEVSVQGRSLRVRRRVGPIGRTREFDLESVARLREEPASLADRMGGGLTWPGMDRGVIAFDYGARSYRFGDGLDGADVATVLELLRGSIPERRAAF